MDALKIGDRIYCNNYDHYGRVDKITADTVDTIVHYTADDGETHCVYAYMIEKA